ncbi:MAG: RNA-directed DNA polymerase [Calothrix sp. CSU_2_0]|nr:RNA-directed DNA polymerase [Calothrix sp. CSU_2_0]
MTEQPRTRQELYDLIRQTSKQEFILSEMIRLGFWDENSNNPEDPAEEIRRQGELQRQLQELQQQNRQLHNEKALKKQLLKQRLEESKRKRQETKERNERKRQERSQAWQEKQAHEITYLGEDVSSGLNNLENNCDRLQKNNLPVFQTIEELAAAMGMTVGQLRFLAFDRKTSTVSHYIRFKIAKKTGGERLISAPMPRMKSTQDWILDRILEKIPMHSAAHGFRRGRSIVTNATPHVGTDVVVNLDLQDFFPSISYKRVKGLFQALGYSEAIATVLALVCTEATTEEVELDGKSYFIATSDRHLPQGAPTSPAITNLLCRRLDKRLANMAVSQGFIYTRYADDLTFSTSGDAIRNLCNILKHTENIVSHEGFTIHPNKTRVLRKSQQQEVTGIVVNEKLNVDRATLKKFRATLHHIEKDGLAGKHWGSGNDLMAEIEGFANYVMMVNPEKGEPLVKQVKLIKKKYGLRKR